MFDSVVLANQSSTTASMICSIIFLTIFLPLNIHCRSIDSFVEPFTLPEDVDHVGYFVCPRGQHWSPSRRRCIIDNDEIPPRPRPYTFRPYTTRPKDLCLDGEILDKNGQPCFILQFDCPTGQTWNIIRQLCETTTTAAPTTTTTTTTETTTLKPRLLPGNNCRRGDIWDFCKGVIG